MRWQNEQWVKVVDSARIVNDRFEICGEVDRLTMATLYYSDLPAVHVFVEQGETTFRWDAYKDWKYTQEGTRIDGEVKLYRQFMEKADSIFTVAQKDFLISLNALNKEIQAAPSADKMADESRIKVRVHPHFGRQNAPQEIHQGAQGGQERAF